MTVKIAASGRAFPYLSQFFDDVEEIWGLEFALEHGEVDLWRTLTKNVHKGYHGVPEDWHRGVETAKRFRPELVVTDFEGFAYLFAKRHRLPVISVGNIQMVDRCLHDTTVLDGFAARLSGVAIVRCRQALARQPLHHHNLLLASHTQGCAPRSCRRFCATRCSRPRREPGEHLLVYGRISETAVAALKVERRARSRVRRSRRRDRRRARRQPALPAVRERGVHRGSSHQPRRGRLGRVLADERGGVPAKADARAAARGPVRAGR